MYRTYCEVGGGSASCGLYPVHDKIGSLGYFVNRESVLDNSQRKNVEPFADSTRRALQQLAQRPARVNSSLLWDETSIAEE